MGVLCDIFQKIKLREKILYSQKIEDFTRIHLKLKKDFIFFPQNLYSFFEKFK